MRPCGTGAIIFPDEHYLDDRLVLDFLFFVGVILERILPCFTRIESVCYVDVRPGYYTEVTRWSLSEDFHWYHNQSECAH